MRVKAALVRTGAWLPPKAHHKLNAAVNYLYLGRWLAGRNHRPEVVADRFAVFRLVASLLGERQVLYLEFGVAEGDSMRYWASLLRHPKSELHGFDSFQGLPDDWNIDNPAGTFGRGGQPPRVDDPRVRFHVGWFSETLPRFTWPEEWEVLIANIDCDLYSSAREVLDFIAPQLRAGSVLYFDEFHDRAHEQRAFDEFLASSGREVTALAASRDRVSIAFVVR